MRVSAGLYVLDVGIDLWGKGREEAEVYHRMTATAFPVAAEADPARFLRVLAAGQIGLGAVLLVPVVPSVVAGAALSAFGGALNALWWRTPGSRRGVRPQGNGKNLAKDVWLLGMGLGLVLAGSRR